MAREGLPPNHRGEKGPLGSSNAMADTDTSPENRAVKREDKPTGKTPAGVRKGGDRD